MRIIIKITFCLVFTGFFSSCIIVKHKEKPEPPPEVMLSPKPLIPMSEEHVRSKKGDMIAFLPRDWFFVNLEEKIPSDVFAVAVNPEYTLSAVFSIIRKNDRVDSIVSKEGLLGLARVAFDRHERKTAGAVKHLGKYETIQMGNLNLAKYDFSATGEALKTHSVVFVSSINQYYEFSLIPMNITGKRVPPNDEIDKIFQSIVATIQVQY